MKKWFSEFCENVVFVLAVICLIIIAALCEAYDFIAGLVKKAWKKVFG